MGLETVFGYFLAGCVIAVVIALFVAILSIALSPVIGVIYLIADWYENKSSAGNLSASQEETEASLKECLEIHRKKFSTPSSQQCP
ncbi:hypothetical protein [Desulfurobacterium atlanticum]|uniref:Uncharacterized protein n=1 Tax=Desulfurobacterium atlanticum TaxID=240169 RepID=A0A239A5J7_9BACT|nr:hypothetical protein [Desulfurobacterium atlanticum]SNR90917.1 hypothetical protein SAMN06265340_11543 [Desulfurobacterium atlanticum]